ncbi:hypothetical protein DSL72_006387 [Monilinia vaccinii-corymbosi]|uniref:C2H2-type domain-containing protein n=1 Tax=Monilinia vaccinii-corymbosi TaxID=61207 RepID=A0A8A3PM35_9HELO|nr:hypothetical protein DSL72_006387 [Monilinia vaccinii-corymbosi]
MLSPDFNYPQDLPQQPLQRFITEPPGRALFTTGPAMSHFDDLPRTLPRAFEPIGVFPQASRPRMISPSPSHELSSNGSGAQSPGTETDWHNDGYYSSRGQDDYTLPHNHRTASQSFSDVWTQPQTRLLHSAGCPCVNLSDVQAFADPQEVKFEADEAYTDMDMRTDYAVQVFEYRGHETASHIAHYRDEGLGASIRDAGSPPRAISFQVSHNDSTSIASEAEEDADIDTHAEVDVKLEIDLESLHRDVDNEEEEEGEGEQEEEASDTEYTPRPSTRNPRKRSSSTINQPISPPNAKRHRISKPSSTFSTSLPPAKSSPKLPAGNLTCKQCFSTGFKDDATLQRHIASSHTRAYICVFDFAGCSSTFASKNEWKRHVSSQHLNLHAWVCTLGSCGKVPLSSHSSSMRSSTKRNMERMAIERGYEVRGSEFNRKDLFTQHLRRMHAPFDVKRKGKRDSEWEERVRGLQTSCERVRREAPVRLGCPVRGCEVGSRRGGDRHGEGVWFEGKGCWDERMEHLGKHLEKISERISVRESMYAGDRMGGSELGRTPISNSCSSSCSSSSSSTIKSSYQPALFNTAHTSEDKIHQEDDPLFLEWSVRVGIIERGNRGEWKLCVGMMGGHGWARKRCGGVGVGRLTGGANANGSVGIKVEVDEDLDAEGEDE